jgi:hypothetical protein
MSNDKKRPHKLKRVNRYLRIAVLPQPSADPCEKVSIDGTKHFRNHSWADYPENQWPKKWGYDQRQDIAELEKACQEATRRARYKVMRDSTPREPVKRATLVNATREAVNEALHKALSKQQSSNPDETGRKG